MPTKHYSITALEYTGTRGKDFCGTPRRADTLRTNTRHLHRQLTYFHSIYFMISLLFTFLFLHFNQVYIYMNYHLLSFLYFMFALYLNYPNAYRKIVTECQIKSNRSELNWITAKYINIYWNRSNIQTTTNESTYDNSTHDAPVLMLSVCVRVMCVCDIYQYIFYQYTNINININVCKT